MTTIAKPFIKSAGGKTKLLPELLARVPKTFGTYYEPFAGGAALFWALQDRIGIEGAVLTDLSSPLARTYRAVQQDVEAVIKRLRRMPISAEHFYKIRGRDHFKMADDEVAAWFIYLNKTCFNGLWRVNRKGGFNVPWGRYDDPKVLDPDLLRACAAVLRRKRMVVKHCDFARAVDGAEKGDFVYFDPPYLPLSKTSNFTAYTHQPFGIEEHTKLRDVARDLKKRKVRVMVSNSAHPDIKELYARGFDVEEVQAGRSVNSDPSKRGKIAEYIIT